MSIKSVFSIVILLLDFLDQEYESFVFIVEMLDFDFHFVNFGGFAVTLKLHDGFVLLFDFEIEFFDDFFEPEDHGKILDLNTVFIDEFLDLE